MFVGGRIEQRACDWAPKERRALFGGEIKEEEDLWVALICPERCEGGGERFGREDAVCERERLGGGDKLFEGSNVVF